MYRGRRWVRVRQWLVVYGGSDWLRFGVELGYVSGERLAAIGARDWLSVGVVVGFVSR